MESGRGARFRHEVGGRANSCRSRRSFGRGRLCPRHLQGQRHMAPPASPGQTNAAARLFPVKFPLHRAAVTVCMAKIDAFFNLMFEQKASDVHLSSGNPPILRINGELQRVDFPPLESDALKAMLYEITPEYKIKVFEETGDVDFGYEIPNISRFRVNFFNQRIGVGAVFRQIPSKVLSFEDFEKFDAPLPGVLKKFSMLH